MAGRATMGATEPQLATWSALSASDDLPKLFIRPTFSSMGYAIHLTDLSRVWHEELLEDELNSRAVEIGCIIDPSDGFNRLILLEHIRSVICGSPGSNLEISSGIKADNVDLTITAILPNPLPALRWTCHLSRLVDTAFAAEIVHPLIRQAVTLKTQVSLLVRELTAKDNIISKICDRLEASGDQLTTVFPAKSNIKMSKKKTQREQLAAHVPGLAVFDLEGWREQSAKTAYSANTQAMDQEEVLKDLELSQDCAPNRLKHDQWWRNLSKSGSRLARPVSIGNRQAISRSSPGALDNSSRENYTEDYGNVEEQAISSLKMPQSWSTSVEPEAKGRADLLDESTDDEDHLDRMGSHISRSSSGPTDYHNQDEAMSLPASGGSSPPRKLGAPGDHTTTLSVAQDDRQAEARTKLGTFGGRSKARETQSMQMQVSPLSKPVPRLGNLGGKRNAQIAVAEDAAHTRTDVAAQKDIPKNVALPQNNAQHQSRTPTETETSSVRQTSQERANEKRNQLKRELVDKSKAPGKKKRRF